MKFSLKNKFIIPTITAAIICLGVMSLFSYLKSSQALEETISSHIKYVSASISKQVSNWISERKSDIANFGHEEIFTNAVVSSRGSAATDMANSRLKQISRDNSLYEFIALAGPDGIIIASSDTSHIGTMNIADRGYFKGALSGRLSLSNAIKSKASGNPIFCIASPVKQNNKTIGVLFAVIDMNQFTAAFIDSEKVGENGYVYMVNKSGVVLAYPDKSKILSLDLSSYDFGRKILSQKNGLMHYTFKNVEKLVAFTQETEMNWVIASTADKSEIYAPINNIRNINMIITAVSLVLIGGIIFLVTKSIVNPLNLIIEGMKEGGDQVAAASSQVAASSQSQAEGASQQAASIEETSSSMEEMSSMTKKMAENANQAEALAKEAFHIVTIANESMEQLTHSMVDISKASEETSKIIKTIDEIAFQTNLLALNAAVEAARAGEAGAGFAVVAEEVRNLAMRAADAAKNTAELIDGTVKKVNTGSELVTTTNEAFVQVATSSSKVSELVTEISQASQEQAFGIEQVNNAIADMDTVVQQNAASAEESASAAEEMNAQAEQLKGFVGKLVTLITGKTDQDEIHNSISQINMVSPHQKNFSRNIRRKILSQRKNEVRVDQMIPLDDDFKDFAV